MTSFRLFGRERAWLGSIDGSFRLVQVRRGGGGGSKVRLVQSCWYSGGGVFRGGG